jgi:hypothetical protein
MPQWWIVQTKLPDKDRERAPKHGLGLREAVRGRSIRARRMGLYFTHKDKLNADLLAFLNG